MNSEKIGLFTDLHIADDNLLLTKNIIEQIITICVEKSITTVYFIGDLLDSRVAQRLEVLQLVQFIFHRFKTVGIDLFLFPGNHDKVDYESEESYLDPYMYHPNITLIRNYLAVYDDENDITYHFIPYFKENTIYQLYLDKAKAYIDKEPTRKKNILLTHVGIDGYTDNNGHSISNDLKAEAFDIFDIVYIGHYHNEGQIGKNIFYVGSTDPRNFAENGAKGFHLIDRKTGLYDTIKLDFKEYEQLVVDVDTYDQLELINDYADSVKDNNKIQRLIFTGSDENINAIVKSNFTLKGFDVKKKRKSIEESIELVTKENAEPLTSFTKDTLVNEFTSFLETKTNLPTSVDEGLDILQKHLIR